MKEYVVVIRAIVPIGSTGKIFEAVDCDSKYSFDNLDDALAVQKEIINENCYFGNGFMTYAYVDIREVKE